MDPQNAGAFLFSGKPFKSVWLGGRIERNEEGIYFLDDSTGKCSLDISSLKVELNEREWLMAVGTLSWAGQCFEVKCTRVFQTKDRNASLIWRKEVEDIHNSIY
jgi:hypothetical protein